MRPICCYCCVVAIVGFGSSPATQISERPIGIEHAIVLNRPLGPALKPLLQQLGGAARVPLGFEEIPLEPLPPRVVRRAPTVESSTPLNGKRMRDALDLIISVDPRYTWNESAGVVNLLPRDQADLPRDPLNIVLGEVSLSNQTVAEALTAIHRALDPQFRGASGTVFTGIPASAAAEEQGRRTFSVYLRNAKLRDVLNAITEAHGELMWFVSYTRPPASLDTMRLEFFTFDGWGRGTSFVASPR